MNRFLSGYMGNVVAFGQGDRGSRLAHDIAFIMFQVTEDTLM